MLLPLTLPLCFASCAPFPRVARLQKGLNPAQAIAKMAKQMPQAYA